MNQPPIRTEGVAQKISRANITRLRAIADEIQAADPLRRRVTFDGALTWLLDEHDKKETNQP